jgi:beta-galactosidase
MREKLLFDFNWKFHQGDLDVPFATAHGPTVRHAKTARAMWGPAAKAYDDDNSEGPGKDVLNPVQWDDVRLPHDYIVKQVPKAKNNGSFGYFTYENAWYRNRFILGEEDRNKRITLLFEAVTSYATVYVNGCLLARNFCGYTTFEVDATDVVNYGEENIVAVYVDTREHEGWWYEGGGITRHVWLIKTDLVSVDLWGVYVHPEKGPGKKWKVPIETTVRNDGAKEKKTKIKSEIIDKNGKILGIVSGEIVIEGKWKASLKQEMEVEDPYLWDTENPNQYLLKTSIEGEGGEVDSIETKFGFRTIRFDGETGFYLNEKPVKIKGVCCHFDYGLTGRAVPESVQRYRLEELKEMGANGYRASHYPHSEYTMDMLDELGFLVMDETRWFESSPEGLRQLEMVVKRDRNRPGVIFWSIGNEEPFMVEEKGVRISETMKAFIRRLDKTRPVTAANNRDPVLSPVHAVYDVIGINYCMDQYDDTHKLYPNVAIVASEISMGGTTRGWYKQNDPGKGYITAYDHDTPHPMYKVPRHRSLENVWKFVDERPWVMGIYQWTGLEYRGECQWPRVCSQSGSFDLFLFKKDQYYNNKAHWTNEPMVHILPHWNLTGQEGEEINVWVYTNCEEVELWQDGKSFGKKNIEKNGHGEWLVTYRPGKLEAKGYMAGKMAAEDKVETTGKASALKLRRENQGDVYANFEDTVLLACYCIDKQGCEVPDATAKITFESNGIGNILGTGSDVSDHIPVWNHVRRMRAGLCAVAVRVGPKGGSLRVYAKAEGLEPAMIEIDVKEGGRREYVKPKEIIPR